jgi:transcriptional regulator with XRE-family HTH domain
MTQLDLAKAIRSSQSRVAKMEAGEHSVSLDLLVRTLLALGASGSDLARFLSASKSAPAA